MSIWSEIEIMIHSFEMIDLNANNYVQTFLDVTNSCQQLLYMTNFNEVTSFSIHPIMIPSDWPTNKC